MNVAQLGDVGRSYGMILNGEPFRNRRNRPGEELQQLNLARDSPGCDCSCRTGLGAGRDRLSALPFPATQNWDDLAHGD